jgi:hypothetical protein
MPGLFWEKAIETMPPKDLRKVQLQRLKKTIRQAAKSPFYAGLIKKHKIGPEKIRSLDNLKDLPFTTKQDLRDQFPYGFPGPRGGRRPSFIPKKTWMDGRTWWPAACTWRGCGGMTYSRT